MEGSGENVEMIEVLFFGSWTVESPNELFLACVVVGIMSFTLQCLVTSVAEVPGGYVPNSYFGLGCFSVVFTSRLVTRF